MYVMMRVCVCIYVLCKRSLGFSVVPRVYINYWVCVRSFVVVVVVVHKRSDLIPREATQWKRQSKYGWFKIYFKKIWGGGTQKSNLSG